MRITFLLIYLLLPVIIWSQHIDSLHKALQLHIKNRDSGEIVQTIKPLVNALRAEKRYYEASKHVYTSLEYASHPDIRFNLINLLGQTYIEMTDYDSAMSQYKQLLQESERANNLRYQGFALNNIGYIYYQNDELSKAAVYHRRALKVRLLTADEKRIGTSYNNIGLILFHQDSLAKALEYYKLALNMFRKANYSLAESNVLNNIGNIYLELDEFQQALLYHEEGLEIRIRDNDQRGIAESYKNIARIYIRQKNYTLAEQAIQEGKIAATIVGSRHLIKEFYMLLYEMAAEKGNYKEALERYMQYTSIKDSLTGIESMNRIAELEIQYESEKKEQQIVLLDRDNKIAKNELRNSNYLLIGLAILFILSVVILILFIRQNRLKTSLRIEQQKQRLLRSQMNPHFMYNALSAIQNFILQNNPMDSVSYISDFSGLMRLVLEGSRNEVVSLSDDINLVQSYLKLQQLRFNNAFEFRIEVGNDIITELLSIPPMLSQPFIENAVEHGMRSLAPDSGMILVKYERIKDDLVVSICDNGAGIREEAKEGKHRSMATIITRERIESIRKAQGIKIRMKISSKRDVGTEVVFLIPQKTRSL